MRIAVVYGTRPERIKLEPVAAALSNAGADVETINTGQSPDLVGGEGWDDLLSGMARTSQRDWSGYDAVVVQGDTATALATALGAFLQDVPVAHVEAGLRTHTEEPFPEEAFRRAIAAFARWHFAPDNIAAANLLGEQVSGEVHVVGNTVIDTLPGRRFTVFATLHRRENWGARIQKALNALARYGAGVVRHPNWMQFDYETSGVRVLDPMSHDALVACIRHSDVVVTDSGGLQEECAHFGVPCIVYRTATERTALLECGAVELCHPDHGDLAAMLERYRRRQACYGNGTASIRIARILCESP